MGALRLDALEPFFVAVRTARALRARRSLVGAFLAGVTRSSRRPLRWALAGAATPALVHGVGGSGRCAPAGAIGWAGLGAARLAIAAPTGAAPVLSGLLSRRTAALGGLPGLLRGWLLGLGCVGGATATAAATAAARSTAAGAVLRL